MTTARPLWPVDDAAVSSALCIGRATCACWYFVLFLTWRGWHGVLVLLSPPLLLLHTRLQLRARVLL